MERTSSVSSRWRRTPKPIGELLVLLPSSNLCVSNGVVGSSGAASTQPSPRRAQTSHALSSHFPLCPRVSMQPWPRGRPADWW